jgi:abhydrolase domain-containing protein 17
MEDRPRSWTKRWIVGEISLRRLLGAVLFLYGSLALFAFFGADWLLYRPFPTAYVDNGDTLKLTTASGARISALFFEMPRARYTVLYSHGNAEDLDDIGYMVDEIRGLGVNVLAYDYEGYGTSEGAPSERRIYEDIDAAYRYLTEVRGIAPDHVIVYGRSLGGGPSVDLASRTAVGGLILESTFTSAFRVLTRARILPWDKFDNLDKMPRVRCPVLVMHGTADPLIPRSQGQQLFDAATGPKLSLWVQGAGHGDVMITAGSRFATTMRAMLAMIAKRESAGEAVRVAP